MGSVEPRRVLMGRSSELEQCSWLAGVLDLKTKIAEKYNTRLLTVYALVCLRVEEVETRL